GRSVRSTGESGVGDRFHSSWSELSLYALAVVAELGADQALDDASHERRRIPPPEKIASESGGYAVGCCSLKRWQPPPSCFERALELRCLLEGRIDRWSRQLGSDTLGRQLAAESKTSDAASCGPALGPPARERFVVQIAACLEFRDYGARGLGRSPP